MRKIHNHFSGINFRIVYLWTLILFFGIMGNSVGFAANNGFVQVGRYSTVGAEPTLSQCNPLSALIQVTFPQSVVSIGDAVGYLLQYSGYALAPRTQQSIALQTVLSKPLPIVDRNLGPMPLDDTLMAVVGTSQFTFESDPINRWVNFKLNNFDKEIKNGKHK